MLIGKNFTKNDLIEQLSIKTGFSKNISKKLIDDLLFILIQNLLEEKLILKNLGVFKIIKKKRRIGRNPKTKEEFIINARKSLTFLPSKQMSDLLN
jgi:integration host factor subunit alpha|tara:strand:- start:140 stop:427 length:288 start_codon:yes stop_codon:yes gene_type:complete